MIMEDLHLRGLDESLLRIVQNEDRQLHEQFNPWNNHGLKSDDDDDLLLVFNI